MRSTGISESQIDDSAGAGPSARLFAARRSFPLTQGAAVTTSSVMTSFASAPSGSFADPRARIELLATLLDSAVRIPGTRITFGADALLNLIPGVGTVAAQALSAWILVEARSLGVPTPVLLRMLANLGFDTLVSAVPVLGWAGDVVFRANRRNVALIRRHLAEG
jgi:hypothetical protein